MHPYVMKVMNLTVFTFFFFLKPNCVHLILLDCTKRSTILFRDTHAFWVIRLMLTSLSSVNLTFLEAEIHKSIVNLDSGAPKNNSNGPKF